MNFWGVRFCEIWLNFCEKIQGFFEFQVKNCTFWLENSKNLNECFVAFLSVNFFEFKDKNLKNLRLKNCEFKRTNNV